MRRYTPPPVRRLAGRSSIGSRSILSLHYAPVVSVGVLFSTGREWLVLLHADERIGATLGSDRGWRPVPREYCDLIAERK